MKIPYTLLDFSGDVETLGTCWDMTLIKDILEGSVWQPVLGYEFQLHSTEESYNRTGMVIVIPARQNADKLNEVQEYLDRFNWVLLILTGDEERDFDYKKLRHPNMKIWLMQPRLDDEADYYLGSGYTPDTREMIMIEYEHYLSKKLDWFFAGQNNHPRRTSVVKVLDRMRERDDMTGFVGTSQGFTQGMPHEDYYDYMATTKSALAPSGIKSPDSFRLYEALEAGAVPIADEFSQLVTESGYWSKVFNGHDLPFKVYNDVANLEGYIADVKRDFPALNNKVFAWWQGVKRDIVYTLNEHIHELNGLAYVADEVRHKITVIILTSPIKSHPDTRIIDQTINDLRLKLPDCEIIIGIDGVRPEQEDYRERYEQYKQQLIWKCNFAWPNTLPVVFEEHLHQAQMTKRLLKLVKTPTILFVEHDTALAPDFDYDWSALTEIITEGDANVIRFHHEAEILPDHKHLMMGDREEVRGVPLIKTMQWSQRPHLASTIFYRDIVDRYFTDESRTMLEDVLHGKVIEDCQNDGMMGWYKWRIWIYAPEGNMKRSYTTDGRGDDPKYSMVF